MQFGLTTVLYNDLNNLSMKNKTLLFFSLLIIGLYSSINAQTQFLQQIGVKDSLYSNSLKESRAFYIQLPTSYTANPDRNYPVVYIIDGEVLLPTVTNVHEFYYGGFMPEMILVGISNAHHRTRDLTPSTITTKYGMPFNQENGKADQFLQFLKEELMPHIAKQYRTTSYRTLIGHSYGGLFAMHTLIHHPELFTNYIAIDPSLNWDSQKLLHQAKTALATKNYKNKGLYLSLGGQLHMQNPNITIDNVMQDTSDFTEFARSNIAFAELIKSNAKNGLTLEWEFFPKELHGSIPFPSIRNGLLSLFEWFQMEKTDRFNSPDTPKEELLKIIQYRAQKLEQHFGYAVAPYPEDLFNMSGYMSLQAAQPEKAKMFFQLAIDHYPKSANVYDSMAEFYEGQKDYKKASEFISKAYKLSGSDYHQKRMHEIQAKL